jgi:hypothetical protein
MRKSIKKVLKDAEEVMKKGVEIKEKINNILS